MPVSDTKNVPITKEFDKNIFVTPIKTPPQEELDVINSTFQKFRFTADHRNGNFANFDGMNLIDTINDSVQRFITNIDVREDIEDWQARVNVPFTRNKVIAFLSKIVQVLPIASFTQRGDDDFRKSQILTNLYEYSEDVDDYEELLVNILLECIIKGTAIGYEGHEMSKKAIREVRGSGDKMTVSAATKVTNRLYGSLVPLEDFYPQNVGIRNIKSMVYCFWRSVYPYQQFLADFASFSRAADVQPHQTNFADDAERPYYLDYVSSDVQEGQVEVIRYYNKDTDEFVMIANGVWLNPITNNGALVTSPIPFNHKELPFWDVRFELYPEFFYGKSLCDKLKSMQDVLNVLTNMSLDQSFLTIFPPILTAGFDSIEDDYIRPGRRTPVDTQGLPLNQQYMPLNMGVPTGWHQFILQYTQSIMEQASLDQLQSGQAGVGGRTTALEIRTATEGVASVLGLFARLVNYGIKRKALLRAKNILQFWTDPKCPIIDQVLGDGTRVKTSKAFNIFKIDNTPLTSGKRGVKIIELYKNDKDRPTKAEAENRGALARLSTNRNVEIISLAGASIRNIEFDIKMVVNVRREDTRELQKALKLEEVRVWLSFFPDLVDRQELAAQLAETMGVDPTKILKSDIFNPPPPPSMDNMSPAQKQMMDQGMSQNPQNNVAQNAMNGMMGQQGAAGDQLALQRLMTG